MQEYWDLYLPDGTPTGERMPASQRIPDDRCTLLIHVFLCNQEGEFLLQKRSMKKKYFPGVWDSTGGRVQAGETAVEAVVREVREEVGLTIDPGKLQFLERQLLPWRNFFELYCIRMNFSLSDCRKQDEEVEELRLVSYQEALALFRSPENQKGEDYLAAFQEAARRLGVLD